MPESSPAPVRDPGPPLGSTADPVGYVPVSWMAVGAAAVAVVFVLVLAATGVVAWRSKSPLILPQLLFLPLVAVVLAFAARRIVRNSEGTRTGELFGIDLINGAWWASVVIGLVYLTYMAAVEYAIRREAEAEVARWVGLVTKDDLGRAFHRTRDPAERASLDPANAAALETRYRNDWIVFSQTDLVRVAARNPNRCEYTPGSLKDWTAKANGVECTATGTLRCPEGVFPFEFPLKAVDATGPEGAGGRQWQILPSPRGFLRDNPLVTPYGWLVNEVQRQGHDTALGYLRVSQDRNLRVYAAVAAAKLDADPDFRLYTPDAGAARLGLAGTAAGMMWVLPEKAHAATAARLFRLPGGKAPPVNPANEFLRVWNTTGIVPAGARIQKTPDTFDQMTLTDTAVEVRVPVELPLASAKSEVAARGRVVLVSDDKALLAELKKLRDEAVPDAGTLAPPPGFGPRPPIPWRLDRIESDMRPVSVREEGPGGGGGMPGMPGG